MSNIIIRKANKEDMKHVCEMIKELAEFEKMGDQCKVTTAILEKEGFDMVNPAFSCLIAENPEGGKLGFALFYYSYSTWLGQSLFLEDLYVRQSQRNTGVGKKLFTAVAKIAHELPAKRLDFHVLSWNPATDFYKKLGAQNLTDSEKWQLFRMDEECLDKLVS